MQRQLLVCVAFDLSDGSWFEPHWNRIVASLKLGKAGPIAEGRVGSAAFAMRADTIPGSDNPRIAGLNPQLHEDGSYTLLTGRIMERGMIAERIGMAVPASDAELYAGAWRKWGAACDAQITGEYAAVQWFPGERKVRLARSALRAPPLHVWREGSRLLVASLPRSIFAAGVPQRLNHARMAEVALFHFGDGTQSYYEGLRRVACGSWQEHTPGSERSEQWWSIEGLPPVHLPRDDDYVAAVEAAFGRSARANLADVDRPAISLSGGLDSQASAVFALQAMQADTPLRSFTAVPKAEWLPKAQPGLVYDESARVNALAARYPRIEPHFVTGGTTVVDDRDDALATLAGWPVFNAMNMHWVHAIQREAAQAGCDALLIGDAGDAGLSYDGLTAYPNWLRHGRLTHLLRELRARDDGRSLWRKAVSLAVLPFAPVALRRAIDKLRGRYTAPFDSWCPLDPDSDPARRAMRVASQHGHDVDLYPFANAAAARASMVAGMVSDGAEIALGLRLLHGIETRDLTAFRPLFELCAGMPDGLFLRDGRTRWLARKLLDGRVPDEVAWGGETAIQSADFLGRAVLARDSLTQMIDRMDRARPAAQLIDLQRLRGYIAANEGPQSGGGRHWLRMTCAVPRGLALARFAQLVEGHNDG